MKIARIFFGGMVVLLSAVSCKNDEEKAHELAGQAQKALDNGDVAAAAEALKKAAALDALSLEVIVGQARVLHLRGESKKALEKLASCTDSLCKEAIEEIVKERLEQLGPPSTSDAAIEYIGLKRAAFGNNCGLVHSLKKLEDLHTTEPAQAKSLRIPLTNLTSRAATPEKKQDDFLGTLQGFQMARSSGRLAAEEPKTCAQLNREAGRVELKYNQMKQLMGGIPGGLVGLAPAATQPRRRKELVFLAYVAERIKMLPLQTAQETADSESTVKTQ